MIKIQGFLWLVESSTRLGKKVKFMTKHPKTKEFFIAQMLKNQRSWIETSETICCSRRRVYKVSKA